MNTEVVKSFIMVARSEGYTSAARELNLNQSTVYQHVRQLEKTIGVRLVQQSGKRVILTDEGKLVLPRAIAMLDELTGMMHATVDQGGDLRSVGLDIAVGTTFGQSILPKALVKFHHKFPNIQIQMAVIHNTQRIDDAILKSGYDGGFHSSAGWRKGLNKVPVLADTLVFIQRRDVYIDQSLKVMTPQSLMSTGIVSYRNGYEFRSLIDQWASHAKINIPIIMELDSQIAIVNAVLAGAGPAIVSLKVVEPFLSGDSLLHLPLSPVLTRDWVFVHRSAGIVPRALAELVREVERLAKVPG